MFGANDGCGPHGVVAGQRPVVALCGKKGRHLVVGDQVDRSKGGIAERYQRAGWVWTTFGRRVAQTTLVVEHLVGYLTTDFARLNVGVDHPLHVSSSRCSGINYKKA